MEKHEIRREETGPVKKFVYISLPFEGDTEADSIHRRLSGSTGRRFFAGKVKI